jgi:hypothetical protein
MKTFIASVIILASLFTAVSVTSGFAKAKVSSLYSHALELPSREEEFKNGNTSEKAELLRAEWERNTRFFSYIVSYEYLSAAEEALLSLCAAASTESAADFAIARLRFISAMQRLNTLFSVSAESIL